MTHEFGPAVTRNVCQKGKCRGYNAGSLQHLGLREVVFLRQRSKLLTALGRVREEVDDLVQIVVEALRSICKVFLFVDLTPF